MTTLHIARCSPRSANTGAPRRRICLALGLAIAGHHAHAQWTVTNLHPEDATWSVALEGIGSTVVGSAGFDEQGRAWIWNLNDGTGSDLHPAGVDQSAMYSTATQGQVGITYTADGKATRACMWSTPDQTWLDLHPAGSTNSAANAISPSGEMQVGVAYFGGARAGFWRSSAASWVRLHPANASFSEALDCTDTQIVGWATVLGSPSAGLWTDSSESWVDLSPTGTSYSRANATSGTQQVGMVRVAGYSHASVWSGTPESWMDLHPAGTISSELLGTSDSHQVGFAQIGSYVHASVWTGTPASWVDLAALLPGSWGHTYARSIWTDGTTTYIAGHGFNMDTGREEALLWSAPTTCPADLDTNGQLNFFDISAYISLYNTADPAADLAAPFGTLNFFDVTAYIGLYNAGCP